MTSTGTDRAGLPAAASVLLAPLLDGPVRPLREVARTRVSVHYATGQATLPLLCVATPDAVRLPYAVQTSTLPDHGAVGVGKGMLEATTVTWRVSRWWRPPQPLGLTPPPDLTATAEALARLAGVETGRRAPGDPVPPGALSAHGLDPDRLVGHGPGLTPTGDDVLAAALVTAHATGDPRLGRWRRATRAALARRRTTAVSRGLLLAALDGWCTSELADFLDAVCSSAGFTGDLDTALAATARRLLALGHTSGSALALGVLHTLSTRDLRGAA
ncbi:MAG: oxamate carbamoyltransferase subunit AllH family protein [Nocardioides sp.]